MILTNLTVVDNTPAIEQKINNAREMMLANMAAAVEIKAKTGGRTPFRKGGLRSSIRHFRVGDGIYTVIADKEYAAAMEEGVVNGSPVRNWTTPGTGPGWFADAIGTVRGRALEYMKIAAKAVGLDTD